MNDRQRIEPTPRTDWSRTDTTPPGFPAAALVQQDGSHRPWTRPATDKKESPRG